MTLTLSASVEHLTARWKVVEAEQCVSRQHPAMSRMSLSSGAEIPQILHALDQGTVMIKFFKRRGNRPEKRIFCLKTDTFEILQFPMARGKLTQCEETSEEKISLIICRAYCSSSEPCLDSQQHGVGSFACLHATVGSGGSLHLFAMQPWPGGQVARSAPRQSKHGFPIVGPLARQWCLSCWAGEETRDGGLAV